MRPQSFSDMKVVYLLAELKIDIPSFLAEPLTQSIGIIENAIKPKDYRIRFFVNLGGEMQMFYYL